MAETFRGASPSPGTTGGRPNGPIQDPRVPAVDHFQPKQADLSLGELFGKLTADVGGLFRKEIQLVKLETKEEAARAGKAAGVLGGAAVVAYLAAILLSFAVVWALGEVMHLALAFLLVGAVYVVVAAVLASMGRARMKQVQPVPEQTVETLKEDVAWARAQRN